LILNLPLTAHWRLIRKRVTATNGFISGFFLSESTSTEISKNENPGSFEESHAIAKRGGTAAKEARSAVEKQTGKPVITNRNAAQLNAVVTNLIENTDDIIDTDGGGDK
jgi:hypothetical protein